MRIPHACRNAAGPRRMAVAAMLGAASLALVACASTGVRVDEAAVAKFAPGKTTYGEVIQALGPPTTSIVRADGHRVILYTYAQARMRASSFVPVVGLFAGGMDAKSTNVSFEFDTQGVLVNDSTSQTQIGTGTGLISGAAPNGAVANQPRVNKP
jgi:outer membrane protein assembly factor BamE (lipoprotein component of BamABCDE complex)